MQIPQRIHGNIVSFAPKGGRLIAREDSKKAVVKESVSAGEKSLFQMLAAHASRQLCKDLLEDTSWPYVNYYTT